MKKLILFVALVSYLTASDFLDITLSNYISIVSKINNVTIIIDDDINKEFSLMISDDIREETYFDILELLLEKNNLKLEIRKGFFYITSSIDKDKIVRGYKFKYIDMEEIKDVLKLYPVTFQYVKHLKTLFIQSTEKQYIDILNVLQIIDKLPEQLKLKITIIDTDINKIKERGIDNILNIASDSSTSFFFNLLAFPFTVNNTINYSDKSKFTSVIKYMDTNGLSSIKSSPTLTIFDNKKTLYDVVKNIPYTEGKTQLDDDVSKTTTSYSYRDVGLKISIIPKIFDDDLFLDFDLTMENVLDKSDTPTTSKRHIKQFIALKKGQSFILTGINQREIISKNQRTPFFSELPYLGWLFEYKTDTETNTNLTILLEVN